MTALEHIGCPYEDELVSLPNGEQSLPKFQNINPRGKVPALLVDGKLLTENAAILVWLNTTFPKAGLLPVPSNDWEQAQILSDLFWLSATWHPYVRANRAPMLWTIGDVVPVRKRGKLLLRPCLDQLEQCLQGRDWWYESGWSIIDTYFYWAYTTAEAGEFELKGMPAIAEHRARIEAMPALQRALEREQAALRRAA